MRSKVFYQLDSDYIEIMPKHYTQKEAMAMVDKIAKLESSVDLFFDEYNKIRSQAEKLVIDEMDIADKIAQELEKERVISDPEIKKEIDLIFPEFCITRDEYMKQLGKKAAFKQMKNEFSKYFFKKNKREN